jgi:methionine-rich copper-binding protein CopC
MMKTTHRITVLAAAAVLASAAKAGAHAFLDHAEPKVGSTVATSPAKVTARFTQSIEPAFSTLKVLDANGKQVDKQDSAVDAKDPAVLSVSVPTLPAGTYTVEWKVTSVDTHRTHGTFTFTVQPKG